MTMLSFRFYEHSSDVGYGMSSAEETHSLLGVGVPIHSCALCQIEVLLNFDTTVAEISISLHLFTPLRAMVLLPFETPVGCILCTQFEATVHTDFLFFLRDCPSA